MNRHKWEKIKNTPYIGCIKCGCLKVIFHKKHRSYRVFSTTKYLINNVRFDRAPECNPTTQKQTA